MGKIICFCKGKVLKVLIAVIIILIIAAMAYTGMQRGTAVDFRVLSEAEIPQSITSQVIPQYRTMERALACVVDDKVYVIATRGEKPSTGYDISIARMEVKEDGEESVLTVYADFRDPEPGLTLAQELTYPLQVAETSLATLPQRIELKVQYAE